MHIVVQISTRREWESLLACLSSPPRINETPVGPSVDYAWPMPSGPVTATLIRGGIGTINSAASAQFAILTWKPTLYVLLGTAGAVDPTLTELSLIVATRTVVYDFAPAPPHEASTLIAEHTTDLVLLWDRQGFPYPTAAGVIASGDGDVTHANAHRLHTEFSALIADWESGAVAQVCAMYQTPCLILRGVTDSAHSAPSEQFARYAHNTPIVMQRLWQTLGVCVEQYVSRASVERPPRDADR
jgi:adenosylhomocysteine nucleosidase